MERLGPGIQSENDTVVWFVGFKMSPYDSCMTCRSLCNWTDLSFDVLGLSPVLVGV
jgi:hypothetical protein